MLSFTRFLSAAMLLSQYVACSGEAINPEEESNKLDLSLSPSPTLEPPPPAQQPAPVLYQRIVGGSQVKRDEIEWQVALKKWFRLRCGGILIGPYTVLTAAHCLGPSLTVVFREYSIAYYSDDEVIHDIMCTIKHPQYGKPVRDNNDFALLILQQKVTYGPGIRPVGLPIDVKEYDNKTLRVSGWGAESFGGSTSDKLRAVELTGWSRRRCQEIHGSSRITNEMMCAGDSGEDTCKGDSGGPLTYTNEAGVTMVVGVASLSVCGMRGRPGVYAKVDTALKWIKENGLTTDGSRPKCPGQG